MPIRKNTNCEHNLVKMGEEHVCQKCGYRCEPRIAREKWGVKEDEEDV